MTGAAMTWDGTPELVEVSRAGVLFPEWILSSPVFGIFTAFVAINTVVYVVLATSKILPKIHFGDLLHKRDRRQQNRSIFPDSPPDARRFADHEDPLQVDSGYRARG